MTASAREKPVIHVNASVDMTRAVAFLDTYNAQHSGVELRYDDLFIFALGRLVKRFPGFCRYMRQEEVVCISGINIGFAVSIEDRLFIPVIKDADQKPIQAISEEIEQLVNRTFDQHLARDDVTGSCRRQRDCDSAYYAHDPECGSPAHERKRSRRVYDTTEKNPGRTCR